MMRGLFLLIFAFIGLASCKRNKLPENVLAPEKMQAVFWDYIRADVYTKDYIAKDSGRNALKENAALQQLVFQKHKVSKETFYRSYEYYMHHQDKLGPMLDTMLVRQQQLQDSADRRRARALKVEDAN